MADKVNFEERNRERVERLLDRNAGAVRAVIANTVETKRLTGKIMTLDMIANKTRQQMGFNIDFAVAKKILEKFSEIENKIDQIIAEAIDADIYRPQRTRKKLKEVREELEKYIKEGKTPKEICKLTLIDIPTIEKWIKTIEAEKNQQPQEEKSTAAKAKKQEEVKKEK